MSFMTNEDIKIIYKPVYIPISGRKPYGIRDSGGFLLFFPDVTYYSGQDERFEQELRGLIDMSNYLHDCLLKKANSQKERK